MTDTTTERWANPYPEGMAWRCNVCDLTYAEDYPGNFCTCGHPLTRTMLVLKLPDGDGSAGGLKHG